MGHIKPYVWCGLKHQPAGYSFEASDYDQIQLIYVTHGRLHFCELEGGPVHTLGPGMALMLPLGCSFRTWCTQSSYDGCFVILRDEDDPAYHGPPAVFKVNAAVQTLSDLILEEAAQAGLGTARILDGLGMAFLWEGLRLAQAARPGMAGEDYGLYWAQRVRQVLQNTLCTGRPARQSLASLRLSYRQLSRHFMAAYGQTPKDYQTQLRIERAKRLLAESPMPVTCVAYEVGFSSSQHFATSFTAHTGLAPSAWRKQAAEEEE